MINEIITGLKNLLGIASNSSIREKAIVEPEPVTHLKVNAADDTPVDATSNEPEKLSFEDIQPYNALELEDDNEFNIGGGEDFELPEPARESSSENYDDFQPAQVTRSSAMTIHSNLLKVRENRDNVGWDDKAKKFDKFLSLYQPPKKGYSPYEIGYGIKIPESWLSDDSSKWPKINGVPKNIKEGLTKEEADYLQRDALQKSYKHVDSVFKDIKMTELEKSFWADLVYNGGSKVIGKKNSKNPKACKAVRDGYPVEGMIRAFDFIGKKIDDLSNGLLRRRLTMYNEAAMEIKGAPIVTEYKFEPDGIKVKFAYKFADGMLSKVFRKKIGEHNWLIIRSNRSHINSRGRIDKDYLFK